MSFDGEDEMNTITLHPWEAELAAKGELKTLVRAMDPQPPKGAIARYSQKYDQLTWRGKDGAKYRFMDRCRLGKPGDELVGLEAWRRREVHGKVITITRSEDEKTRRMVSAFAGPGTEEVSIVYQPASTMPPELARFRWTVGGVRVAQGLKWVGEEKYFAVVTAGHGGPDSTLPKYTIEWVWQIDLEDSPQSLDGLKTPADRLGERRSGSR